MKMIFRSRPRLAAQFIKTDGEQRGEQEKSGNGAVNR